MDDCVELESDPAMVSVAREFVRDRLAAWEATEHTDEAALVASELVTNAILHARTAFTLKVEARESPPPTGTSSVRIEVYDQNPRLPTVSPMSTEATSGRGLALVAEIATAWGMENRPDGKVVWAEIGSPRSDLDPPDDCVDLTGVDNVADAMDAMDADRPADGGTPPPADTGPEQPAPN